MDRKSLIFISLVILLASGCVPEERPRRGRAVRVALLRGANAVTLSSKGVLVLKDARSGKALSTARRGKPITVRFAGKGLNIAGTPLPVRSVHVKSSSNEMSVNGKTYPGSLRIHRREGGLLVVNSVDLDTYLKGVVASEMPASWPEEALKAQAVVSRSFVLFHALRNSEKDYDIGSKTQVYNPDKRDARTDKAVDATRKTVLFYKGKLLLSFFSTSCGGFTEYAANVWQSEGEFPPSVRCPFCREAEGFRWRARMTSNQLRRRLRATGITGARGIAVHRKSASGGRVTALKIKCDDGDNIIRINRFRMALGPNVIKSGFFEIEVEGEHVVFRGRGWGHGVGMCQRGAKVLAERGKSFKSILHHYFPGARTKKMRW